MARMSNEQRVFKRRGMTRNDILTTLHILIDLGILAALTYPYYHEYLAKLLK